VTPAADLAKSFVADVYARHARHFVDLLIHTLDKPKLPPQALDLACGDGFATLEVLEQLPKNSRIIALSDDRFALRELHNKLDKRPDHLVFPRKERPDRLPFALSTFDLAWLCLPTRVYDPVKPIIRQALRALRPGGQLVICVILRGSFVELTNALGALEHYNDRNLSIQHILAQRPPLNDLEEWEALLHRCGGIEISANKATFELVIEPPASKDRLVARHLLPVWLGREYDDSTDRLLDTALTQRTIANVVVGCLSVRRGLAEIVDSSVA